MKVDLATMAGVLDIAAKENAALGEQATHLAIQLSRLTAQVQEAIAILNSGTDYERMHVVSILQNGLPKQGEP